MLRLIHSIHQHHRTSSLGRAVNTGCGYFLQMMAILADAYQPIFCTSLMRLMEEQIPSIPNLVFRLNFGAPATVIIGPGLSAW